MGHGYERHLPILTCLLVFILLCNCFGLLPGDRHADRESVGAAGPRALHLCLLQLERHPRAGADRLHQALYGTGVVDRAADVPHRDHLAPRPHHVAHGSSLRQHVCQRSAHGGLLLARSACDSRSSFSGCTSASRSSRPTFSCCSPRFIWRRRRRTRSTKKNFLPEHRFHSGQEPPFSVRGPAR